MRIGIDACLILSERRGSGEYVYKLIKNLIEIDKENQYVLFYRFMREAEQRKKIIESFSGTNVENKVFRIPGYFLDFFWNTFSFPSIDLMLGKLDLFHYPFSYNPPPISSKWIVTVHDLMWQRFNAHYTKEELNGYERTFSRIKREAALVLAS